MTIPVHPVAKKSNAPLIVILIVVGALGLSVLACLGLAGLTFMMGGNSQSASIEQVLRADAMTSSGATSVAEVVVRMRAINLDACPDDFRAAYLAHIHAWEMMATVESQAAALKTEGESGAAMMESFIRGFLGDPFGKANEFEQAENQLQRDYRTSAQQVKLTFDHVNEIAVAHGARLPRK